MVLGQKVSDIPTNKHTRDGNWNAGALRIKCIINGYCPFEKTPFADQNIIFNHETMQSAPDYINDHVSSILGETGVFLKERHFYHSQYLFIGCEALCPDIGQLTGQTTVSTTTSAVVGGVLGLASLMAASGASAAMVREFTWDVTDHVFLKYGDRILKPSEYLTNASDDNADKSRWECERINLEVENSNESGDPNEASDSNVIMPAQVAANPYFQSGIHWRARKRTPLFRGEDFFVELRRVTVSTDLKNRDGTAKFENTLGDDNIYRTLDVTRCEVGDDKIPINGGVVSYRYKEGKLIAIDSSKELFDFTRQAYFIIEMGVGLNYRYCIIITQKAAPRFVKIVDKKSYLISEYGSTTGNELFNEDVLKIAIRNHLGKIVIVFNNNYNDPWVVEDIRTVNGQKGGGQQAGVPGNKPQTNVPESNNEPDYYSDNNYVVQTVGGVEVQAAYEGSMGIGYGDWIDESSESVGTGADIDTGDNNSGTDPASTSVESTSTDSTGYQDNSLCPATPPEDPKDPTDLFEVPHGHLALWGGNLSAGFLFSPIQYISHYSIPVPLPSKEKYDKTGEDTVMPFIVPGQTQILLSLRDMGLDKDATPRNPGKFKGKVKIREGEKIPFYICDAHEVKEYSPIWRGGFVTRPSEFMDYGGFIKDERKGEKSRLFIEKKDAKIIAHSNAVAENAGIGAAAAAGIAGAISSNFGTISGAVAQSTLLGASEASTTNAEALNAALQGLGEDMEAWYIKVFMKCGSHVFPSGWSLKNCKTPILTNMRLIGVPKKEDAWATDEIDASDYVMHYNDNWSAQDYSKMEHDGELTFLINRGPNTKDPIVIENLRNKAFYVQILAGYWGCNYTKLGGGDDDMMAADDENTKFYKLMTGICYGGVISERPGERIMRCKVHDYSKVAKDILLFNSPFFDGVRDINAIYELFKYCQFKEDEPGDPAFLLQGHAQHAMEHNEWGGIGDACRPLDGRVVSLSKVYALPHSYQKLQGTPEFRFSDGSSIMDSLHKISERSGKPLFFDVDGMLHYEAFPIADLIYGIGGAGANINTLWYFTESPDEDGQLIFNILTRELAVGDVYNNIHIITSSPKREYIMADRINEKSMKDPSTEGFLGYRKTFLQMDGVFGSEQAAEDYANHLTKFYRPPVVYKFETFGLPLRCFDVAEVDGQKLIVLSVSHSLDAKENKWWMTVETEWLSGEVHGNILSG